MSLSDTLIEITRKGLGMTVIINQQNVLMGIFTDGDLRRTLDSGIDIRTTLISEVMTQKMQNHSSALAGF